MTRTLEHVESEFALVGSLILDPACAEIVSPIVSATDITDPRARTLYTVVSGLIKDGRPLDAVTLKAELEARGLLEAAGGVEMIVAALETPTAAHAKEYARRIRRSALHRTQLCAAKAAARAAEAGIVDGAFDEMLAATKQLVEFDGEHGGVAKPEHAIELLAAVVLENTYLLRPLLSTGNLTILQGEPKGGKSCFAFLLALAVSLGAWPCSRFDSSGHPAMVLFITWEDGRRRIQRRLRQYLAGFGDAASPRLLPSHLLIHSSDTAPRIRLDEHGGVLALRELVKANGIKLLVLDTLSHVSGADENSKREMQPVMDELKSLARDLDVAVLVLHHTAKAGKDPGARSPVYKGRGSSVIAAAADCILDWGSRTGNVTPCTLISKDDDGDRFNVEYVPEGEDVVRWRLVDAEDDAEKYPNRRAIVEALMKLAQGYPQGVTRAQVAMETKLAPNTVKGHLERMAAEGTIRKIESTSTKGTPAFSYLPGGGR